MTRKEIREAVDSYDTRYQHGFTNKEFEDLCEQLGADTQAVREKIGVVTCMIIEEEIITYHCDVELGLRLYFENREPTLFEFD